MLYHNKVTITHLILWEKKINHSLLFHMVAITTNYNLYLPLAIPSQHALTTIHNRYLPLPIPSKHTDAADRYWITKNQRHKLIYSDYPISNTFDNVPFVLLLFPTDLVYTRLQTHVRANTDAPDSY